MVHDEDGDVMLALEGAEVAEQGGDLAGVVLVDAVQTDEGVEHEQAWCELADGGTQAGLVAAAIEAQHRRRDDMDRRVGQIERAGTAESGEPRLDDRRRVLGHVEQDGPRMVDVERIQAGCARGDGDREVEGEPGFAGFGGAAEDADGTARPEGVDEPAWEGVAIVEVGGADDRERVVVRNRTSCTDSEFVDRSLDGGFVEEALAALGSQAYGGAKSLGGDAQHATARAKQHLHGLVGKDLLGGPRGLEAVLDGGAEHVAVERLEPKLDGDARAEGGVLLHVQAAGERRQTDEPERQEVTAVEREVEKPTKVEEEVVGEVLGLIENDQRDRGALVDHVDERLLDVGPQLAAAMRGPHAEFVGERAIQVERRDRGVAQVQDEVIGPWQLATQVTECGGLADAGLGGDHTEPWIVDELAKRALDAEVPGALVKEGLALGILG